MCLSENKYYTENIKIIFKTKLKLLQTSSKYITLPRNDIFKQKIFIICLFIAFPLKLYASFGCFSFRRCRPLFSNSFILFQTTCCMQQN